MYTIQPLFPILKRVSRVPTMLQTEYSYNNNDLECSHYSNRVSIRGASVLL